MKCYVINLDRSKDRLEYIARIFNEHGLDFERVAATDGALLSDEEFKQHNKKYVFPRELVKAEIGCFLSHRECWRRIIEGEAQWAAIFEDDIILSPNLSGLLQDFHWIPDGTDIVKLDTAKMKCTIGQRSTVNGQSNYQIGRLLSDHCGTGGYIISRQCAKSLFDSLKYAAAPIDEIYFNLRYGILGELNVQQMIPAMVIHQSLFESTINGREPDKRKGYDRSITSSLAKEVQRTYIRRIRPYWLALTRGYKSEEVDFQ